MVWLFCQESAKRLALHILGRSTKPWSLLPLFLMLSEGLVLVIHSDAPAVLRSDALAVFSVGPQV